MGRAPLLNRIVGSFIDGSELYLTDQNNLVYANEDNSRWWTARRDEIYEDALFDAFRHDEEGDVYADLGEVRILDGRRDEAALALEQALARYERKGNVVMAARTRERFLALGEEAR